MQSLGPRLYPSFGTDLWHCPVQTSASSMTPVLHPRNNFQEPAQTHFLLRSTAKETPQEQCREEGMLQTQQQQVHPEKPLQEPNFIIYIFIL